MAERKKQEARYKEEQARIREAERVAAERAAYEEKKRRANRKAEEEAARVAARRTKEDALRRSEAEEYSDEPDDLELPDAAPKSTFIDKLRRRIAKLVDDVDGKDDNSTDL